MIQTINEINSNCIGPRIHLFEIAAHAPKGEQPVTVSEGLKRDEDEYEYDYGDECDGGEPHVSAVSEGSSLCP